PLTVSITVEAGKITACEVTENRETPYIAAVALERLPKLIVEHQTTTLDSVTGATLASNAIKNAAAKACEAAGLDKETLKANAWSEPAGEAETWDVDVLVVGGGGAGLSAATTAAQNGAKTVLIEKSSFLGGNTMMAGGAYNAVDPEAQANMILTNAQKNTMDGYLKLTVDDPDLHFDQFPEWKEVLIQLQKDIKDFYAANAGKKAGEDMPGFDSIALHMWHIYTGGLRQMNDGSWVASNIDLARTLAENALGSFEWLESIGIYAPSGRNAENGLGTVLGAMWPRTHSVSNSSGLIDLLEKAAVDAGVTIYKETRATGIVMDGDKVVGATAQKANGTQITINTTKGVVLACGGYGANAPMVKQYDNYWGDALSDRTLTTNVGTNTGDGIEMATAVGAATTGLQVVQMMPSSSPTKGTMTDGIWGDASAQIWIDGNGNRFVDEYAERDVLTKASLNLDGGIFYIICAGYVPNDKGMLTGINPDDGAMFGTAYRDMIDNHHVWWGSTLAELVENSKTPAGGATPNFTEEGLRATIEKYNKAVADQNDPEFGKEVLAGAIDLEAIEADPNMGIFITPRKASIHHTMGGVVINTEAEVLREDGSKINGLWAAGEVCGGVHAGNRLGGNAEADIFTFGHIAGTNASK
nr:FAD-dependent oxidoreductase [Lachnospiraceae bacterium]